MRKFFKINILRSLLRQCVHYYKFLNFACLVRTILHMGFYARSQLYPSAGHRTHARSRVVRSWGAKGRKWELRHTPDMEPPAAWVLRGPFAGSGLAAARSSGSSSFFSPMCTQQYQLVVLVLFGGVTFWIYLF